MIEIVHTVTLKSSLQRVFEIVTDHENLSAWLLPGARVELVRSGTSERNGVGAIRSIKYGPFVGLEEIVAYEAPNLLQYTVRKGLPLREHLATVTITGLANDMVAVTWRVRFQTSIVGLGWLIKMMIDYALSRGLKRLPQYLATLK